MKLNPECIKDTLLFLEDNLKIDANGNATTIDLKTLRNSKLNYRYNMADINYSVSQLYEAKLINAFDTTALDGVKDYTITDISAAGHQFLKCSKNQGIWKWFLSKLEEFDFSIALNLLFEFLKNQLPNL